MPSENKDEVLWQAYLPGNFESKLDESRFMETLLPRSKLVA